MYYVGTDKAYTSARSAYVGMCIGKVVLQAIISHLGCRTKCEAGEWRGKRQFMHVHLLVYLEVLGTSPMSTISCRTIGSGAGGIWHDQEHVRVRVPTWQNMHTVTFDTPCRHFRLLRWTRFYSISG